MLQVLILEELAREGEETIGVEPMFTKDSSAGREIYQEQLLYWVVLFESADMEESERLPHPHSTGMLPMQRAGDHDARKSSLPDAIDFIFYCERTQAAHRQREE